MIRRHIRRYFKDVRLPRFIFQVARANIVWPRPVSVRHYSLRLPVSLPSHLLIQIQKTAHHLGFLVLHALSPSVLFRICICFLALALSSTHSRSEAFSSQISSIFCISSSWDDIYSCLSPRATPIDLRVSFAVKRRTEDDMRTALSSSRLSIRSSWSCT